MRKFFGILRYVKGYWRYGILNIIANILSVVFGLFSLTMVAPFLNFLFNSSDTAVQEVLQKGKPVFSLSASQFIDQFNYYLAVYMDRYGKMQALVFICISVIVMIFFKNLFRYLAMYFVAPIRNGVVRDIRNRMMDKVTRLHLGYFSEERKGDIMSRITTDVMEIEWSVMQSLEMIFREPLTVVIYLAVLVNLSPLLTLYALGLLPLAALVVVVIGRSLKRSAHKNKVVLGALFSIMEETLGGLKVIKAFTSGRFVGKKFMETNQQFYKLSNRVYRINDLASPVSEVLVTAIMMLLIYFGGQMAVNKTGGMDGSIFITYIVIFSQLMTPVKQLSVAYVSVQRGIASAERIDKILDAEIAITDKNNAAVLPPFSEAIEFRDLSFAYTKGDEGYVLKNISLRIPKGKTIALVGQSGSGKTTLADMIPRFYEASEGAVLIDGVDVRDVKMDSLRAQLGIVSQEPILFNDTVFNNIAFGSEDTVREKVMEAARIANADEFIRQLPGGYDANIGDRGSKLSGGQRQRLSIARAVLKNPPILILDEATSALDTESERLVQDALTRLMANRTTVIIAHRLSTIVHADEIVVLHQGRIIERGTHSDLLMKNGTYKKLYDMQSFQGPGANGSKAAGAAE